MGEIEDPSEGFCGSTAFGKSSDGVKGFWTSANVCIGTARGELGSVFGSLVVRQVRSMATKDFFSSDSFDLRLKTKM